jgi:ABC-2 type transport system permease protein
VFLRSLDAHDQLLDAVRKETLRFWKVAMQTVAAPVLTALLYLVIFGTAFTGRVQVYDGVPYASFSFPAW